MNTSPIHPTLLRVRMKRLYSKSKTIPRLDGKRSTRRWPLNMTEHTQMSTNCYGAPCEGS